jgi:magnesium chelatase family protein
MLYKTFSAAVYGIDAYPVEVEVDVSAGMPNFTTVGLPDAAVRESRERITAAGPLPSCSTPESCCLQAE